ncbi:hypothetical protein [Paraflavitalea pollutisoli]|uniref:hypothetical protein n=1 Tax=Paraflavitalea pollutisoli TaxID=3034143 RepID=UPI0023EC216D|nr:hypothetical protein [Paraflavitalea sp. H1-2-19X]
MKYLFSACILLLLLCSLPATAQNPEQERLDLPGDNLNLYAVLKLFQESPTLEQFERALNSDSANINNLDLDGDEKIDYIQVVDSLEGDIHNIILKVYVSETEEQNVAVIIVERDRNGEAKVQIVGDEDLYGKDYIVEPNYSSDNHPGETPNPGYAGQQARADAQPTTTTVDQQAVNIQYTTTYQVAAWPIVSFMYAPGYMMYRSPWHWGYYPPYWRPWAPVFWHQYYGYHYYWDFYYFGHFRRWNYYRFPGWHHWYYRPGPGGPRFRAPIVHVHISRGYYNRSYSRPDLAGAGRDRFRRDNPKAPSFNNRPPSFDNNGRPQITRPARPGGTTRPITRPGGGSTRPGGNARPGTRPVNPGGTTAPRPGTTRPVNPGDGNNPGTTRPGTRPVNPGGTTRPVNPGGGSNPGTPRPGTTRPVNPGGTTRPGTTRPVNPGGGSNPSTRPSTRPAQPSTRPAQPSTRPSSPAQRPATSRPTRPGGK